MEKVSSEHAEALLTPLSSEQKLFWNLGFRSACIEMKSILSEVLLQINDPEVIQKIDKSWEKIRSLEKKLV